MKKQYKRTNTLIRNAAKAENNMLSEIPRREQREKQEQQRRKQRKRLIRDSRKRRTKKLHLQTAKTTGREISGVDSEGTAIRMLSMEEISKVL